MDRERIWDGTSTRTTKEQLTMMLVPIDRGMLHATILEGGTLQTHFSVPHGQLGELIQSLSRATPSLVIAYETRLFGIDTGAGSQGTSGGSPTPTPVGPRGEPDLVLSGKMLGDAMTAVRSFTRK